MRRAGTRPANDRQRYEASGDGAHFNEYRARVETRRRSVQRTARHYGGRVTRDRTRDERVANLFDAGLIYGRPLIEKRCYSWRIREIGKPCSRGPAENGYHRLCSRSRSSAPLSPFPRLPSTLRRLGWLYSGDRTFCSSGGPPISKGEKLAADLRGVTRLGFTYLLTRHRRVAITPLRRDISVGDRQRSRRASLPPEGRRSM